MSSDTTTTSDAAELEALRERLAALEAGQQATAREKQATKDALGAAPAPPIPPAWAREVGQRQDAARAERLRLAAQAASAHEARLERDRPKIEALEAKIAELTVQERDAIDRSAKALEAIVGPIRTELTEARREHTALMTPPAPPRPPEEKPREQVYLGRFPGMPVFAGRRSS